MLDKGFNQKPSGYRCILDHFICCPTIVVDKGTTNGGINNNNRGELSW